MVATAGCHDKAERRRSDDPEGELRTVLPGRLHGRVGTVSPRCDGGHDDRLQCRHRRLFGRAPSRSIPKSTCSWIPTMRAPRTDEYSIGVDRAVGRRLTVSIAYVRKDGSDFISWTDVAGQYVEGTQTLADGRSVAGVPAEHGCHSNGSAPLSVDESRWIFADLQRPRDGGGKAPVERLAGVRLVHVVEGVWAAALQRHVGGRHADQHRLAAASPRRSDAIPTISPTRAAACPTIARTSRG